MTREEKIELLQDQIEHGRISSAELGAECEKNEIEGVDYCALCWDCIGKLKEKGLKYEHKM